MSISISFGSTTSEKRELDKNVSYSVSLTGTLRNETGVVDPTILVQADVSTIAGCNYMSIPAFGRLYFITEIKSITDKLCEVSGHCDVLSTYKTGIRTNRAVIGRSAQEGNWNLYLNDPMMKITNKSTIITKKGFRQFPKDHFTMLMAILG